MGSSYNGGDQIEYYYDFRCRSHCGKENRDAETGRAVYYGCQHWNDDHCIYCGPFEYWRERSHKPGNCALFVQSDWRIAFLSDSHPWKIAHFTGKQAWKMDGIEPVNWICIHIVYFFCAPIYANLRESKLKFLTAGSSHDLTFACQRFLPDQNFYLYCMYCDRVCLRIL